MAAVFARRRTARFRRRPKVLQTQCSPAAMFATANDTRRPGAVVRAHYAILLLLAAQASAQEHGAAGLWRTLNDRTGEAEGLVRITESEGELRGEVVKVFSPPAPSPAPLCE